MDISEAKSRGKVLASAREVRVLREIAKLAQEQAVRQAQIEALKSQQTLGFQKLVTLTRDATEAHKPIAWPELDDHVAESILREIDDLDDETLFTQKNFSSEIAALPDQKFRPILEKFVKLEYILRNPLGKGKWGYLKDKMPEKPRNK